MDKTALSLLLMISVVAATGMFLVVISAVDQLPGSGGSVSSDITGYVALDEAQKQTQDAAQPAVPEATSAEATPSADSPVPVIAGPSPFKRTLTIFFVTFLIGIAAYIYFHPEY